MSWRRVCALSCALGLIACNDLESFETAPGEAYCGDVAALFATQGFLLEGVPPTLALRLELNPEALTQGQFGVVSSNDASNGLCAPEPLLRDAALRAIEPLAHDPLSHLQFGDGRDRNVMAWADTTCLGTLVAVVSFMSNQDVEVRLLKPRPAVSSAAPVAEQPGFAVFHLEKRGDRCF